MRQRAILILAIAVILASGAVLLARNWLEQQIQPAAVELQTAPTQTIVVARNELSFGNRLARENLKEIPWPADSLPAGSFKTIDVLLKGPETRTVLRPIEPNEPILASKISGPGGRATLSTLIAEGMRAVTIRVNDVHGVAGFVLPGDRVDVLLTRSEGENNPITTILLQNVKVLGIDQEASDDKEKPQVAKAATLEVAPRQAQKLALGAQVGNLSLALRNLTTTAEATTKTVRVSDLRNGEANDTTAQPAKKVAEKPVRKKTPKVRVVRSKPRKRFQDITIVRALTPSVEQVIQEPPQPYYATRNGSSAPHSLTPSKSQSPRASAPLAPVRSGLPQPLGANGSSTTNSSTKSSGVSGAPVRARVSENEVVPRTQSTGPIKLTVPIN
jgi:pilus assembly protein CpaB